MSLRKSQQAEYTRNHPYRSDYDKARCEYRRRYKKLYDTFLHSKCSYITLLLSFVCSCLPVANIIQPQTSFISHMAAVPHEKVIAYSQISHTHLL